MEVQDHQIHRQNRRRQMVRRYYIQIIIFCCMINNQVAKVWEGDDSLYRSISGEDGYPMWYHTWVLFDHNLHIILCLVGMILLLKYPLKGEFKEFAIFSVVCSLVIVLFESATYLYYGNNYMNEQLYYYYLGGFTASLIFYKSWNGLR